MKNKTIIIAAITSAVLSACAPGQTSDFNVPNWEVVKQSAQCGSAKPEARWLTDNDSLQAAWADRTTLGGTPTQLPPSFPNHWLLYLSSGQKSTSGYSLTLNDVQRGDSATLKLDVHWLKPLPDRMVAQMITQPCLILALEKDSYSVVQFTNEAGETVTLPTPK